MSILGAVIVLFAPIYAPAAPNAPGAAKLAQTHFLQGVLLERRGAEAEALKEYEEAFAEDPNSPYICRQGAELAIDSGETEAAARWVSRLWKLEPKQAQTYILRGRLEWSRGDSEAAQADFEDAIKLDPSSSEPIFSLGSLLSAKSPEKARELFLRFIKKDPEHAAEAHFQIALLDEKAARPQEAIKHLKEAIELEPGAAPAIYNLAQLYEVQRDTEAALERYLEILKLEPQNVALLNHIGELYFIEDKIGEAKVRFDAARALSPSDPSACQWLSMLAEREGDFARAADYVKASSALSEDPTLNLRLSYYLTQASKLKEAVVVLEAAHAHWPANDEISYFLALGYDDLKETAKAVELLRKVVAIKPDFRDARYQLAVLLEKSNRMEEAETEFRALLSKKPDDASILNYLGYSLADRGLKLDAARELIERAVRIDGQNPAYQDSLGWVYFKLGRSTEAVKELSSAADKIVDDATVWDHLGDALAANGAPWSAWKAWKRAQAIDSAGEKPRKKAERIEGELDLSELGVRYLELFSRLEGELRKFSGLCELRGTVLGHSFTYNAVLTYHDGDKLDVDLLGPLFTPLLRVRLGPEGFTMDPIHIQGLDPAAVTDAAIHSFSLLRDFFSGKIYEGRPAVLKKAWGVSRIETPAFGFKLDSKAVRLDSVSPNDDKELRLELGGYGPVKGRQLPADFKIVGKGFSLGVYMQKSSVEFK